MRRITFLAVAGIFLLAACDSAQDLTAPAEPEIVEPLYHWLDPDLTPDGDKIFSMYYFDLNLRHNLVFKVGQSSDWTAGMTDLAGAECSFNENPDHNTDYTGGPPITDPNLRAASGIGSFVIREGWRRRSGLLIPKKACWFDEWNPQGFPESAWVWGYAWQGLYRSEFWVKLESRGFPEVEHIINGELDLGELWMKEGGTFVRKLQLDGELHHEDGLALIG